MINKQIEKYPYPKISKNKYYPFTIGQTLYWADIKDSLVFLNMVFNIVKSSNNYCFFVSCWEKHCQEC
jgi:hypothetical protein